MASKIVMNRAKRGIYAGRHIRFGNKVSEDGGNKSRRTWKPNVQKKRLFSLVLDRHIRVDVTMHALRCIDRKGGIDEYLMSIPEKKLDTERAVFWRRLIAAGYAKLYNTEIRVPPQEVLDKLDEDLAKMRFDARGILVYDGTETIIPGKTVRPAPASSAAKPAAGP